MVSERQLQQRIEILRALIYLHRAGRNLTLKFLWKKANNPDLEISIGSVKTRLMQKGFLSPDGSMPDEVQEVILEYVVICSEEPLIIEVGYEPKSQRKEE